LLKGDFAQVRLRPGINYTLTADSADSDDGIRRGGTTTQLDITSGRFFPRMPWSINYRNDVFDVDKDDSWGRASGTLSYRFSARYRLGLTFGYDSAKRDDGRDDGGFRWRSTLYWTPGPRTSLSFGIGEAFYGEDWIFTFKHRYKHTSITGRYYKNIETVTTSLLETEVIPLVDPLGNEIVDPITGRQLGVAVGTPALVDDVFLNERFNLRFARSWGRTSGNLSFNFSNRDYDDADLDSEELIVRLGLSRRLAPRTTTSLSVDYWDHREDAENAQDFEEYGAQLSFNYKLGPRTSVGLRYRYTDRDSSIPEQNFDEGRFNLNIGYRL
jgi:uncharacterized protein (PEP-CTERM system associated)